MFSFLREDIVHIKIQGSSDLPSARKLNLDDNLFDIRKKTNIDDMLSFLILNDGEFSKIECGNEKDMLLREIIVKKLDNSDNSEKNILYLRNTSAPVMVYVIIKGGSSSSSSMKMLNL